MITEKVLEKVILEINARGEEPIGIRLPDGRDIPAGDVKHRVIFKNRKAFERTMKDMEMGFGEGYMRGDITVDGDLEKVLIAGSRYVREIEKKAKNFSLFFKFGGTFAFINKLKERRNVQHHYDLGNDFYKLWLDESMTYSCAFFSSQDMSLEEAQREKRRIIFEKLLLEEGDTLLDVGCGWGSLIIEAAREYGVRSVGITLSENQYRYVKELVRELGLGGKVDVYLMHYADLPKLGIKFNKVVSVGMFEHVGREKYRVFFRTIEKVMEDGGLFLLHTIGKVHPAPQSRWIRKYIFPGGYLPAIPEVLCAFEGLDFCLIDIDDWRPHYYRTLKEWRRRFLSNVEKIRKTYGDEFVRMWDLYLISSAVSFYTGSNHLFQFLLSKGTKNDYPVMKRRILKEFTPAG